MQRIRIGVVGLNFGRHIVDEQLARGPASSFFELAALCDTDEVRLRAACQKSGLPGYASLAELLADQSVPVIGLFTGPKGRAQLIRRIVAAGKDVMTTKPFEVDAVEAEAVLREAAEAGRVVYLNSPSPTLPRDLAQIETWRGQHALGRPLAAQAAVWAHYRETADGSWYDDAAACPVAPIFRLGIYLINDLVQLFGRPASVQVAQSRLFTGRPTADHAQLTIAFAQGAIASVFASFCINDHEPYKNALTLHFENGSIYRNVGPGTQHSARSDELTLVTSGTEQAKLIERSIVSAGSGVYDWESFHRAIQARRPPDAAFGHRVADGLRIIHAMARAAASGRTESVL